MSHLSKSTVLESALKTHANDCFPLSGGILPIDHTCLQECAASQQTERGFPKIPHKIGLTAAVEFKSTI